MTKLTWKKVTGMNDVVTEVKVAAKEGRVLYPTLVIRIRKNLNDSSYCFNILQSHGSGYHTYLVTSVVAYKSLKAAKEAAVLELNTFGRELQQCYF